MDETRTSDPLPVEHFGDPLGGPLLLTCEHASNRVPAPLRSSAMDRAWLETHWGYDIGARTITREIARTSGSAAILARFSRLVCDPNRAPGHSEFVRSETEGHALSFNRELTDSEIARRLASLHAPYHAAVDGALAARRASGSGDVVLISIHTFTPVWNMRVRPMDVGVLFGPHEAVARRLVRELGREGFETAENQPYSARDGLVYAVERHGTSHGVVYLELEINQSLTCTAPRALKTARRVAAALARLQVRQRGR